MIRIKPLSLLLLAFVLSCKTDKTLEPTDVIVANAPDETYNRLFTINEGIVGGNLAHSVALPDGRSLWIFADSYVGKANTDRSTNASLVTLLKNSAMIQDEKSFALLNEKQLDKAKNFVEATSGSSTSIVAHGAFVAGNVDLFVHDYSLLQSFVKLSVVRYSFPALKPVQTITLKNVNNISYGDYIYSDTQHHYIFGREKRGTEVRLHVARADLGMLTSQATWKYFDGQSFIEDYTKSKSLLTIAGLQFSVIKDGAQFKVIYQKENTVMMNAASTITGPYANSKTLFTITDGVQTGNAFVHSQIVGKDGQYLVSYDVLEQGLSGKNFYKNADSFRPKFYRHNLD